MIRFKNWSRIYSKNLQKMWRNLAKNFLKLAIKRRFFAIFLYSAYRPAWPNIRYRSYTSNNDHNLRAAHCTLHCGNHGTLLPRFFRKNFVKLMFCMSLDELNKKSFHEIFSFKREQILCFCLLLINLFSKFSFILKNTRSVRIGVRNEILWKRRSLVKKYFYCRPKRRS